MLTDGLMAVEAACAEALAAGIASADVILNILARRSDPAPASPDCHAGAIAAAGLPARADCARYDGLRHRPITRAAA